MGGMRCPLGAHYLPVPGANAIEVIELLDELGVRRTVERPRGLRRAHALPQPAGAALHRRRLARRPAAADRGAARGRARDDARPVPRLQRRRRRRRRRRRVRDPDRALALERRARGARRASPSRTGSTRKASSRRRCAGTSTTAAATTTAPAARRSRPGPACTTSRAGTAFARPATTRAARDGGERRPHLARRQRLARRAPGRAARRAPPSGPRRARGRRRPRRRRGRRLERGDRRSASAGSPPRRPGDAALRRRAAARGAAAGAARGGARRCATRPGWSPTCSSTTRSTTGPARRRRGTTSLYGSAGLGYVDAMHQSTRPFAGPTVLTAYCRARWRQRRELAAQRAAPARRRLARLGSARSSPSWRSRIPTCRPRCARIDLMRYGHAMSMPAPGVRSSAALRRARRAAAPGPVRARRPVRVLGVRGGVLSRHSRRPHRRLTVSGR